MVNARLCETTRLLLYVGDFLSIFLGIEIEIEIAGWLHEQINMAFDKNVTQLVFESATPLVIGNIVCYIKVVFMVYFNHLLLILASSAVQTE